MKRRLIAVVAAASFAVTLTAAATPTPTPVTNSDVKVTPPADAVPYPVNLVRGNSKTVVVSETQLSASISEFNTYTTCTNSATTGEMRFWVRWLRDTAPNPDKVRPFFFTLQNGFGNTVGVTSIVHYARAGTVNWWTNDDGFVLTTPHSSGSQQAGNYQNSYLGDNTPEGRGSLPARPLASDRTGNKWTIHRPQTNGTYNAYGNSDSSKVETYSPYNNPWWTELRNDGPYFLAYYHVNGNYSTCDGWYPP